MFDIESIYVATRNWVHRYEKLWNEKVKTAQKTTPRPSSPIEPSAPFVALASKTFGHLTYGALKPCLIPSSLPDPNSTYPLRTHAHCAALLSSHPVQRILSISDLSTPTYIVAWKRTFATHLRLSHFDENLFNATVLWSNADVREKEGYGSIKGDILVGLDFNFNVE